MNLIQQPNRHNHTKQSRTNDIYYHICILCAVIAAFFVLNPTARQQLPTVQAAIFHTPNTGEAQNYTPVNNESTITTGALNTITLVYQEDFSNSSLVASGYHRTGGTIQIGPGLESTKVVSGALTPSSNNTTTQRIQDLVNQFTGTHTNTTGANNQLSLRLKATELFREDITPDVDIIKTNSGDIYAFFAQTTNHPVNRPATGTGQNRAYKYNQSLQQRKDITPLDGFGGGDTQHTDAIQASDNTLYAAFGGAIYSYQESTETRINEHNDIGSQDVSFAEYQGNMYVAIAGGDITLLKRTAPQTWIDETPTNIMTGNYQHIEIREYQNQLHLLPGNYSNDESNGRSGRGRGGSCDTGSTSNSAYLKSGNNWTITFTEDYYECKNNTNHLQSIVSPQAGLLLTLKPQMGNTHRGQVRQYNTGTQQFNLMQSFSNDYKDREIENIGNETILYANSKMHIYDSNSNSFIEMTNPTSNGFHVEFVEDGNNIIIAYSENNRTASNYLAPVQVKKYDLTQGTGSTWTTITADIYPNTTEATAIMDAALINNGSNEIIGAFANSATRFFRENPPPITMMSDFFASINTSINTATPTTDLIDTYYNTGLYQTTITKDSNGTRSGLSTLDIPNATGYTLLVYGNATCSGLPDSTTSGNNHTIDLNALYGTGTPDTICIQTQLSSTDNTITPQIDSISTHYSSDGYPSSNTEVIGPISIHPNTDKFVRINLTATGLDGSNTITADLYNQSGTLITGNRNILYNNDNNTLRLNQIASGDHQIYLVLRRNTSTQPASISKIYTQIEVNIGPTIYDDYINITYNSSGNTLNVLADNGSGADSDDNGNIDTNSINTSCPSCSDVSNGTLINQGNGIFNYTPNTGRTGDDQFVYQLCDIHNACGTGTVTITTILTNTSPNIYDDPVWVNYQSTGNTINVLIDNGSGADNDPDGTLDLTTLSTSCPSCSSVSNGTLISQGSGLFNYEPQAGFSGRDNFVYQLCDNYSFCGTATVSIEVRPSCDANSDGCYLGYYSGAACIETTTPCTNPPDPSYGTCEECQCELTYTNACDADGDGCADDQYECDGVCRDNGLVGTGACSCQPTRGEPCDGDSNGCNGITLCDGSCDESNQFALSGQVCDDTNPFTDNDVYDGTCTCAGTRSCYFPNETDGNYGAWDICPHTLFTKTVTQSGSVLYYTILGGVIEGAANTLFSDTLSGSATFIPGSFLFTNISGDTALSGSANITDTTISCDINDTLAQDGGNFQITYQAQIDR